MRLGACHARRDSSTRRSTELGNPGAVPDQLLLEIRVLAWLRFNDYYGRRKDAFSVFRALLQLPGDVQRLSQNHIKVELQRPDSNKVATALEALMHELNQEKARLLGDGPILSFALASSVNMNSLDTDPLTEEF